MQLIPPSGTTIPKQRFYDMKKLVIALAAALVCCVSFSQHRMNPEAVARLKEDPTRAGVNTNSYEFLPIHDTPAPSGFKPFYISHYGRHGSRSDWGLGAYRRLEQCLVEAGEKGILTDEGKALLEETRLVIKCHDNMNGRLTPLGFEEHKKIASRMYHRYPRVFKKGSKKIHANSSTSQRCIVSGAGFLVSLAGLDSKQDISMDTGEEIMAWISSDMPKQGWKDSQPLLDALSASFTPDTLFVRSHLFTDEQASRSIAPSAMRLMNDIYAVGRVDDPFELHRNIFRHLPFDALYKFWEWSGSEMYIRQCNSVEFGDLRMTTTVRLADDFINRADAAISTGEYCADLRFGHDYGLLALVSYFRLAGVGDRLTFDEACYKWLGDKLIPFASNLQMIFYRNRSGEVLVKFLYNEQENLITGLEPYSGPYYRWSDFKAMLGR